MSIVDLRPKGRFAPEPTLLLVVAWAEVLFCSLLLLLFGFFPDDSAEADILVDASFGLESGEDRVRLVCVLAQVVFNGACLDIVLDLVEVVLACFLYCLLLLLDVRLGLLGIYRSCVLPRSDACQVLSRLHLFLRLHFCLSVVAWTRIRVHLVHESRALGTKHRVLGRCLLTGLLFYGWIVVTAWSRSDLFILVVGKSLLGAVEA